MTALAAVRRRHDVFTGDARARRIATGSARRRLADRLVLVAAAARREGQGRGKGSRQEKVACFHPADSTCGGTLGRRFIGPSA
jgi:hypothetical protein